MTDVEAHARRLLDLARTGHEPSYADMSRVGTRLHARLVASPALFAPKAASALTTAGKGMFAKVALALSVGAGIGTVLSVGATLIQAPPTTTRERPLARFDVQPQGVVAARPATQAAPDRVPVAAVPELALSNEPEHLGRVTSSARVVAAVPEAVTESEVSALAPDLPREIAGLRLAEQALHAGQPAQAVALLDDLDRSLGAGSLAEERMAVRVIALCALGRRTSPELEMFFQRYGGSVHAARVRAACAGTSSKSQTESAGSDH